MGREDMEREEADDEDTQDAQECLHMSSLQQARFLLGNSEELW